MYWEMVVPHSICGMCAVGCEYKCLLVVYGCFTLIHCLAHIYVYFTISSFGVCETVRYQHAKMRCKMFSGTEKRYRHPSGRTTPIYLYTPNNPSAVQLLSYLYNTDANTYVVRMCVCVLYTMRLVSMLVGILYICVRCGLSAKFVQENACDVDIFMLPCESTKMNSSVVKEIERKWVKSAGPSACCHLEFDICTSVFPIRVLMFHGAETHRVDYFSEHCRFFF